MTTDTKPGRVLPKNYSPPVRMARGTLLTCRGVCIGGELLTEDIDRMARRKSLQQSAFSRAAQRPLLLSRSSKARKSWFDGLISFC